MSQLGRGQAQQPSIILRTPPGQVVGAVTDTETVSTTTAVTVQGVGTQPIVVTSEPSKAFWNTAHQASAIVLATPPGQVIASVTATETATTSDAELVQGVGTAPIVVSAEPSRAFWTQQHQPPAIVLTTPPGAVTGAVTATETVSTTATATTSSAQAPATQPTVVQDLTGTYWQLQRQRPAIVLAAAPGQVTADVSTAETATTTTAATVAGIGTQPTVVNDLTDTYWTLQRQRPAALIVTPPGQVSADVSDVVTVGTTASGQTQPQPPAQPIVVSAEPSRAYWNTEHQQPAIVTATPPGALTASMSTTESATTITATTVAGSGTAPIVVSDLTGTYWTLQRQRAAIVVIQPPGKVTADVTDTETVSTTATAAAVLPQGPAQPVVYSDQLGPYLRRALSHQPPALLIAPLAGAVTGQVSDTLTVVTTATATLGGGSGAVTDTETAATTATAVGAPAPVGGSWWSLVAVLQQNAQEVVDGAEIEAGFCPHDGTAYLEGANGALVCPFDGYSPDPGAVRAAHDVRAPSTSSSRSGWGELSARPPFLNDDAEVWT